MTVACVSVVSTRREEKVVGKRSSTETLICVFIAFWERRTWTQVELAQLLGVEPDVARSILDELARRGWPLEHEGTPPHVSWSLPRDFFPRELLPRAHALRPLLRVIARSTNMQERDALVRTLGGNLPTPARLLVEDLVPRRVTPDEARALSFIEGALAERVPIAVRYYSPRRGRISDSVLSVQRVLLGPPGRCVGFCHASERLRWLRVDSLISVCRAQVSYHQRATDELEAFITNNVEGLAQRQAERLVFRVRDPEARWVRGSLPEGLAARDIEGGIRVETDTAGLLPIARFVVGLGDAAQVESRALRDAVRALAEGALRGAGKTE